MGLRNSVCLTKKTEAVKNGGATKDSNFEKEFVDTHNKYRSKHGAPPLTMSRDLCKSAQAWADHLLSIKKVEHSDTEGGENIYYAWSSAPKTLTGKEAVDSWYGEIKDYDFSQPGPSMKTGHFTQVVWKSSEKVGVGLATDGNTVFVVGQYSPAGNISTVEYFQDNVLAAVHIEVRQKNLLFNGYRSAARSVGLGFFFVTSQIKCKWTHGGILVGQATLKRLATVLDEFL